MAKLRVASGPLAGRMFEVSAPHVSIGRDLDNTVRLAVTEVSRHHAVLIRDGDDYKLRDLASTNGTYVNDARVSETIIRPDDRIRFASVETRFEAEVPLAAPPAPTKSKTTAVPAVPVTPPAARPVIEPSPGGGAVASPPVPPGEIRLRQPSRTAPAQTTLRPLPTAAPKPSANTGPTPPTPPAPPAGPAVERRPAAPAPVGKDLSLKKPVRSFGEEIQLHGGTMAYPEPRDAGAAEKKPRAEPLARTQTITGSGHSPAGASRPTIAPAPSSPPRPKEEVHAGIAATVTLVERPPSRPETVLDRPIPAPAVQSRSDSVSSPSPKESAPAPTVGKWWIISWAALLLAGAGGFLAGYPLNINALKFFGLLAAAIGFWGLVLAPWYARHSR